MNAAFCLLLMGISQPPVSADSYLHEPCFHLGEGLLGKAEAYEPQPGDIFLATDQELWAKVGHWIAGGAGVHHSGILFRRTDGSMGLLEAGPFNSTRVELLVPQQHLRNHLAKGDRVWIRRRLEPLTEEQNAALTRFAEAQVDKPFATLRLLGQVTPFRSRGPVRTYFVGKPHGERSHWFCSELVSECLIAAGLVDPRIMRPAATYPRDLFFGQSINFYLDRHLPINTSWHPPARWVASSGGSGAP